MEALDADHDGTISAEEISKASESLKSLDKNNDGKLSDDEVRPPRPAPAVRWSRWSPRTRPDVVRARTAQRTMARAVAPVISVQVKADRAIAALAKEDLAMVQVVRRIRPREDPKPGLRYCRPMYGTSWI